MCVRAARPLSTGTVHVGHYSKVKLSISKQHPERLADKRVARTLKKTHTMFGHNADAPARTTVTNQLTSFDGARETYRSPRPCGSGRRKIRFPIARAHNSQMYAHTRSVGGITESYASDQRARARNTGRAIFKFGSARTTTQYYAHTHTRTRVCACACAIYSTPRRRATHDHYG